MIRYNVSYQDINTMIRCISKHFYTNFDFSGNCVDLFVRSKMPAISECPRKFILSYNFISECMNYDTIGGCKLKWPSEGCTAYKMILLGCTAWKVILWSLLFHAICTWYYKCIITWDNCIMIFITLIYILSYMLKYQVCYCVSYIRDLTVCFMLSLLLLFQND